MPLCFEIQVNDERPILAGLEELDVLTAIVTFVSSRHELDIRVGGLLDSDEHVDWIERKLEPGDRLSIHIVDASGATGSAAC